MKAKIMKSLVLVIIVVLLLLPTVAMVESLPRFIDEVGLLTQAEAATLTAKLDEISERHQFDTVVAVVPALDHREARLFAVDFFEENGFGFGDDLDGIILLLAMDERDFGLATLGYGLYAFTDVGQDYLVDQFLPHLRNDAYFEAFMAYADTVEDLLTAAEAGIPYNVEGLLVAVALLLSVFFGEA